MGKYVIVWNDESEGVSGVTGPYDHRTDCIKVIHDYIDDIFSADGEDIWKDVEWWGGWKIEVRLGSIVWTEILSLDSAVYS